MICRSAQGHTYFLNRQMRLRRQPIPMRCRCCVQKSHETPMPSPLASEFVWAIIFRSAFMTAEVIMWDKQNNFGFLRTATGKTFCMRGSSFCDSRHVRSVVAGARVEFEEQPRDKSFNDALSAGLFRDDPRIRNHRNPRIVDKEKRPTATKVRLISQIRK